MFMLKEMLKGTTVSGSTGSFSRPTGSLWTVEGSSDGVNGALDGVDRLTGSVANSFDGTKWVHAASGSAHSWIVLKSPAALGPVWMCIDANSATTTTYGVVFSREAFVAPFPTTPFTASRPITNNGWLLGVTTDPTSTNSSIALISDVTTGQVYRAHISIDTSGAFHFLTNRNGTGLFNWYASCFNTVDQNPQDTRFNTFCTFDNTTTGRGSPSWNAIAPAAGRCTGRTQHGVSVQNIGGFCTWAFGGSNSFTVNATVDTFSGSLTGSFTALPPYIWSLVASRMGWRGRMPDAWVFGLAASSGDFYPVTGSQTHIIAGNMLIPFTLSASL